MGVNLIRFLLKKGCTVRSIDLEPFNYPERDAIEAVVGDIRDTVLMGKVSRDIDAVVHCAAALPLYSPEDIYTTDVVGTKNVLTAAFAHGARAWLR